MPAAAASAGTSPSHDEILELARETREIIELLYAHPSFNKAQPETSPKMLWHTADFLRRTYTDYIAPLLPPAQASLRPDIAFADPRCEDPRRELPGAPPRSNSIIHDPAVTTAWPPFDAEKFSDAHMRNVLASKIILQPDDMMVQMMFPGASGYDFGEEIRGLAAGLGGE